MERSTDLCCRAVRVGLALVVAVPAAWANPSGGVVTSGSATIGSSGSTLTVNQATDQAIINWNDFSIASGETTRFVQPSATSAALNRVTSANPSSILGTLSANGQIYLINPNGITVGADGVINTQSFIASTLGLTDSQFLAGGDMTFSGPSQAGVVNAGQITALGGDVLLVGRTVRNTGTLTSENGTTGLAAGSQVLFATGGNQRVFVQAGSGSGGTGVDQQGQIQAASAELAAAGGNVYALAINNAGPLTVDRVRMTGDRIALAGDTVTNGDQVYTGAVTAQNSIALTSNSGALTFNGPVNTGFNLTTNSAQHTIFRGAVSVGSNLTSNITSSAGSIDIWSPSIVSGGDQTYTGPIFVAEAPAITSLFGNLTFNGKINGIHSTPNTGFQANMRTSSAWNTNFNGPVRMGTLTSNITSPGGAINLNTGSIFTFFDQTYNGPVRLGRDISLTFNEGNLNFNGTVDGGHNLTAHPMNNANFNGAVGSISPLAGLSVVAGMGTINLNGGEITTINALSLYGIDTSLHSDTTLTSTEGNISFDSSPHGRVGGGYNLTTNSHLDTHLGISVDSLSPLESFTANITGPGGISLARESGVEITTVNDQTYNGAFSADPSAVLTSNSADLTFSGIVNAHDLTTHSARNTTFKEAVTANTLTSNITSPDGAINLDGGSVWSNGDQTYNGAIFANSDTVLTSNSGNLDFNGPVNAGFSLLTHSAQNTNFSGPVFLGNSLTSNITSPAGAINLNGGSVVSGGDQTYNGAIKTGSDNTLNSIYGNLNFNGVVDGEHNLRTESAWNTSFNQALGGDTPLNSLTSRITGSGGINLNDGAVTTVNDQTYDGVIFANPDTVLSSNAGNLHFAEAVNAGFNLTTNSAKNTSFGGPVFVGSGLTANITAPDGAIILQGGSVISGGDQTYNGPINVNSDMTLNSLFGNLTFNGVIDGFSPPRSLTTHSAWNTTFNARVALSNLTSTARGIFLNGGDIITWSQQTYNGPVMLGNDAFLGSDGGSIRFNGSIDGEYNLDATTKGNVIFNGAVGAITPLADLRANTDESNTFINGGSVTTVGEQTYSDQSNTVHLGADTTLTSTAGSLHFHGKVDGAHDLTTSSSDDTNFFQPVGSETPLESLTANITGPGSINLHGNTVTTTGPQTYNGPVNP